MTRLAPALLMLVALLPAAAANSQISGATDDTRIEPPGELPIEPHQCEKWLARVDALADSSDPISRDLGQLLSEPELRYCQTRRTRVDEPREVSRDGPGWDLSGLASLLRVLVIAALIVLCLWLLARWASVPRTATQQPAPERNPRPDRIMSLAEDDSALPSDILAESLAAWQAGQIRRALSLLYRGALARLWSEPSEALSRTESEVLAELSRAGHPTGLLSLMRELVRLWQRAAWAGQSISESEFRQLQADWQQWFAQPRRVAE